MSHHTAQRFSPEITAVASELARTCGADSAWPVFAAAYLALLRRCGPFAPAEVTINVGQLTRIAAVPAATVRSRDLIADLLAFERDSLKGPAAAVFHWAGSPAETDAFEISLSGSESGLSWQVGGAWAGTWLQDEIPHCYSELLSAMLSAPDKPIGELAIMTESQLTALIRLGQPVDNVNSPRLVHHLVQAQARSAPNAVALRSGDFVLTYQELNERANKLARKLRSLGAERDQTVALLMERSSEMLVAFLAILKSGAAAVLLDPFYPADRIAEVLDAAGPRAILTLARLKPSITTKAVPLITVDVEWPDLAEESGHNLDIAVHPQDVAYIVHTSGSTGRPRRVAVLQRSVAHSIVTHQEGHRIEPGDRAAWLSPPGSSTSVGELWPYLSAGASVHAPPKDIRSSAVLLRDWLVTQRITKAFVSMPLAEHLFTLPWPEETALRLLTVGSDKVRRWAARDLPFEVAVACGSSEANGMTSCLVPHSARLTSATATDADRQFAPPIGRPWPGVRIEILDEQMRRVPPGAVAEIYVGGPELARGYLDDPQRTADRFVPDPFGPPGERLYRTGDLACFDSNGFVHHWGRFDRELKIRGFRVDPAEVEAALLSHDLVQEAIVIGAVDRTGTKQLCAYLVAPGVDLFALRESLEKTQAPHAVPTAFTLMDRLPVTVNGKVDRNELPQPAWDSLRKSYREPTDELERQLVGAWEEVLPAGEFGIDDDFFHLGGDSLSASRLATRLTTRLRVRVTARAISEYPTVSALAAHIRALRPAGRRG